MAGFKDLDFNERRQASQAAREAALAKLKAKPARDPAEIERRRVAAEARDAAQAARRAAAKQAIEDKAAEAERVAAEQAAAEKAAELAAKPIVPKLTDEERKAARDAKYAARKKRRGR
ncbi:MAG: DUF6481 family protein [Croceibacterium sp.]